MKRKERRNFGTETERLTVPSKLNTVIFLLIFALVCFALQARAQDKYAQQNFQPGIPYAISDIESINTTNGNLMLNFDFGSVRARGTATQGVSLKFNSKQYESHVMTTLDVSGNQSAQKFIRKDLEGGWQYDMDYRLRIISRNNDLEEPVQAAEAGPCQKPNWASVYTYKLMMYFPDGSQHEFRPTGYSDVAPTASGAQQTSDGFFNVDTAGRRTSLSYDQGPPSSDCPSGPFNVYIVPLPGDPNPHMTYYSTDGTFMRLEIPNGQDGTYPNRWTLHMADGSKIKNGEPDAQNNPLPQRVYDKNENFVTTGTVVLPDGSTTNGYIDQVGRYVVKKAVTNMEDWVYKAGFAGETVIWKVRWKHITVIRKYTTAGTGTGRERCCYSRQVHVSQHRVVDEIESPAQNGSLKYTFSYDAHDGQVEYNGNPSSPNESTGWGELLDITLPSGAKTQYGYSPTSLPWADKLIPVLGKINQKNLVYSTKYDGITEQVNEKWLYSINDDGGSTITGPDGAVTTQEVYSTQNQHPFSGRAHTEIKPDGTKIERIWQNNQVNGLTEGTINPLATFNPYVKTEFVSVMDNSGNYTLTAIKDFEYDKNGNVTRTTDYDWVPHGSVPRDSNGLTTGIPANAQALRSNENSYFNPTENASNTTHSNQFAYWNPSAEDVTNSLKSTTLRSGSGTPVSRTEIEYDNPGTTANPIKTRVWDSNKGGVYRAFSDPLRASNSIEMIASYDTYGNVLTSIDAKGITTQKTYGSIGGFPGLYPTETKTSLGESVERTMTAKYDFHTGRITETRDEDNGVATKTEYDGIGRAVKTRSAADTADEVWTRIEYHDQLRRIVVRSDLETIGDGKKVAIRHYDELGRTRLVRTLENVAGEDPYNESQGIKVQTRYRFDNPANPESSNGTFSLTSNPYRASSSVSAGSEDTMGWSVSYKSKTGRSSTSETFSGAGLPGPWGSNDISNGKTMKQADDNAVLVSDATGRQTRSIKNAMSQLIRIDEPNSNGNLGTVANPTQPTYYKYAAAGQLVEVTQGIQKRYFLYDTVGRLIRIRQPEQEVNPALSISGGEVANTQWTAAFNHDANGNILNATDAENKVITATYDNANRVLSHTYSDGSTPSVSYTYDDPAVSNSKGRLTKLSSSVSTTETTAFDKLGRPTDVTQTTAETSYPLKYTYNLSGQLVEEEYPSGRKVKNDIDANGDISRIYGKPTSNGAVRTYATGFDYTADGKIRNLRIGNYRWETAQFNSNLQVTELALGTSEGNGDLWKLNYEYGELNPDGSVDASKNTGNAAKLSLSFEGIAAPFVQSFKYDSLYRLSEAKELNGTEQTWIQTYDYDRYGNRSAFSQDILGQQLAANNVTLPAVDAATNRFSDGQGYEYDKIGNLKKDVTIGQSRDIKFDGNNKQTEIKDAATGIKIGEYFYDGNGKRVKKRVFDSTGQPVEDVIFVYSGDRIVAEYSTQSPASNPTTKYVATDTLGSIRAITDQTGKVISRRDFMPFGEELGTDTSYRRADLKYNPDDIRQKFTGYQKDEETGLDFAEARMYNNTHGRFTAVDPLLASGKSANPQTFNRYTYVMNNPISYVDPDGLQAGRVVVPNRVKELGNQKTARATVGNKGGNAQLTPALRQVRSQLASLAYQGQGSVANLSQANRLSGGEFNPTSAVQTNSAESSTGSTHSGSGTVGVDTSKGGGVSASSTSGSENRSDATAGSSEAVDGDLTNVRPEVKELFKETNLVIVNYLNSNETENGAFKFLVNFDDGTAGIHEFSRDNVEKFLQNFVNNVRNEAECDFNENSCPRWKPRDENNPEDSNDDE